METALVKKILITGSSGFLGQKFTEEFAGRHPQAEIKLLAHRKALPACPPNCRPIEGSLEDIPSLENAAAGIHTVIHFAGKTHAQSEEEYFRVNAEGTRNLTEAAKRAGATRFIFISSRAITKECGAYAVSKCRAEEAVRESGIPYVILRLSEVYGRDVREGIGEVIKIILNSPLVPYPAGAIELAPLLLDDAVKGISSAAERSHIINKVYNLAGPRSYGFREMAEIIAKTFSRKIFFVPIPMAIFRFISSLGQVMGRPKLYNDQIDRLLCKKDDSIEEARRDLDFSPLALEEGLHRINRIKNL